MANKVEVMTAWLLDNSHRWTYRASNEEIFELTFNAFSEYASIPTMMVAIRKAKEARNTKKCDLTLSLERAKARERWELKREATNELSKLLIKQRLSALGVVSGHCSD